MHVVSTNVPAKSLYTKLDFKEFEKIMYLVGNVDSFSQPENVKEIQIRNFQKNDLDAVYELIKSSEDPKHLETFNFNKSDLKTSFIQRIFHVSTENKIVALYDNRIVGYAQAIYTTPNEAGRIRNV